MQWQAFCKALPPILTRWQTGWKTEKGDEMTPKEDKLVEFEGYFRSQEFVSNALGLREALKSLNDGTCPACGGEYFGDFHVCKTNQ
jgi:hypothetical protein